MESLFLFFKGLIIGIGKIIPGVSGSLIAVMLHVYEEAIVAINHFMEDPKKYFCFLFPIGLGVILSTVLFSNVLLFFLNRFYVLTIIFFLGLILGTVPDFQKRVHCFKKSHFLIFGIAFLFPFLIPSFSFSFSESLFWILLLGMIDATTMIIPGISGTAIFLMLGSYETVLSIVGNPFQNLLWTILFVIGMALGVILVSRFVEYALKHHQNFFYIVIDGLLWSSIIYLISLVSNAITLSSILPFFLLFMFGFFLTYSFSK